MDPEPFADWLARLLAARGWQQRELAAATGVTQQTVSRWLLGQCAPSGLHARGLAQALGVPTDEVLARLAPRRREAGGREAELAALRARVAQLEAELRAARRA